MRLFLWLFISIATGALIIIALQKLFGQPLTGGVKFVGFLVNIAALHGGSLVLIGLLLKQFQIGWKEAFGFDTPGTARAITAAVATCAAVLPVTMLLLLGSQTLMDLLATTTQSEVFKPVEQQAVQALRETEAPWEQVVFGCFAVLMAPVVEELLFRGVLYPTIKQAGWPRAAWWGTSFLFAFTHANVMTFVSLFTLSMALIWLYERTANLLAPIVTHALFNGINLYWLFASQQQVPPAS